MAPLLKQLDYRDVIKVFVKVKKKKKEIKAPFEIQHRLQNTKDASFTSFLSIQFKRSFVKISAMQKQAKHNKIKNALNLPYA